MYHFRERQIYSTRPPVTDASPAASTAASTATIDHSTARRILVAEDADGLRTVVVRTLSAEGYAMTEARHGEAALRLIEQAMEPFDLVVTDVMMPVMSGYKLGRRLAECRPGLPVLYMSASPDETLVHCGLPPGFTPLLRKPFRPEDLVREVAELLRRPV